MRAFVAIDLNDEVRGSIGRLQEKLRASDAEVKWVKPYNAHLTLKFLAEISEADAESVKLFLDEIAQETRTFSAAFSGLGFFPNEQRPRVLWVGIREGANELRELAEKIDDKTATLGIPKEKRGFSPHLTLGRFKSNRNLDELMRLVKKAKDFHAGEFAASEIHLIQSVLSRSGPTYTKLHTASFSGL